MQKWVPYSQRYLFNAIPDTNHNANPTSPNRYSKGNPNLAAIVTVLTALAMLTTETRPFFRFPSIRIPNCR